MSSTECYISVAYYISCLARFQLIFFFNKLISGIKLRATTRKKQLLAGKDWTHVTQ
jgi:hypothetical protein